MITRAEGTGYNRWGENRDIYTKSSKLWMITQNATQYLAKISSKSTIVHSMNICRDFVFREILDEVRRVELQGEAFPALFF